MEKIKYSNILERKCDKCETRIFIIKKLLWSRLCDKCFNKNEHNNKIIRQRKIDEILSHCDYGEKHDYIITFSRYFDGGRAYKNLRCKNGSCRLDINIDY